MSAFDWLLIAILAYSTIKAFLHGIILELLSLGGLIAGILLASWNYLRLAASIQRVVTTPPAARVVAFFLILAGVLVLSALLGKVLTRTVHAVGLGLFDRLLGAVFGFARGCLLDILVLAGIATFLPHSTWVRHSQLSSYFLSGAHAGSFVVPHDLQQQILSGAAQLKHSAPDWIKSQP
jgi:membrane protein required for colicin V production